MKQSGIKDVMTKTKTVAAATTLLAGLGVATNVHADEVTENTQPQTQTPTETAEVTQADVTEAKTALDTANQVVSTQEAQTQEAAKAADEAQATYNDAAQATADAQELANQATPEAINKAQADVTEANTAISKAEDLQAQAESNQATAESAVANQTQMVSQAKDQVTAAQEDVASAQKDVNDKQAILDGTGSQAVINEQAAAQADKETKEAAVTTAEANLTKAQQADKARETAIQTAQDQVNSTTQAVATKKADLDTKQDQASKSAQALDKAKADYTKAENDYKSINTIQLSQAYIDALKVYADGKATAEQKAKATETLRVESARLAKLNVFKANPNEPDYKWGTTEQTYDAENLPDNVVQELSLFGSALINQIRAAVGSPETVVTPSSVKLAQLVRQGYQADNWDLNKGHDIEALKKAAETMGIDYPAEDVTLASLQGETTLGSLKLEVYNSIIDFMFSDYEWYHAGILSCVGNNYASYMKVTYFGFENGVGTHFLFNSNASLHVDSNFDTTPIANPYSSDKIIAAYNTAKATLDIVQAKANTVNQELAAAQTAYNLAASDLNKAQEALNQAKAAPIQTPQATANLATAKTAYAKAQERLTKANQAVASLNADVKAKQANLATAKQALTAKQDVLVAKKNALAQEQAKLDSLSTDLATAKVQVSQAKANVDKAKAAYDTAKAYLAKLQNAPQALKVAQANLATAKTALLVKLDTLKASLETLQDLKAKQATAQSDYDKVSTAYQKVLDAKEQARLQEEYNTLVAQGKQPIPVMDETGKVTGYTVLTPKAPQSASEGQTTAQSQTATVTPTAVKVSTPIASTITKSTANSLPMTGDTTSTVALLFGTLLTLFGLVGVRKKETK